jgi:glycosyltransferase involved in cell wall biosynthesis
LRIALMAPRPPDMCGVADYSARLQEGLQDAGIQASFVDVGRWNAFAARRLLMQIRALAPDLVHLQYPAVRYGAGLAPQLVALVLRRFPLVVTLHEYREARWIRRIACAPLLRGAQGLVLTNETEARTLAERKPWVSAKIRVIPIGSNIPFCSSSCARSVEPIVVFFGLIRPGKGLEEFIQLAEAAALRGRSYRFKIVGSATAKTEQYFRRLRSQTQAMNNLSWRTGLSADEVAHELADASFAYLHFPDGASERRGSLLAAMGNETVVITNRGRQTPEDLNSSVLFCKGPHDALQIIDNLIGDPQEQTRLRAKARSYAEGFSWKSIAEAHRGLYAELVGQG